MTPHPASADIIALYQRHADKWDRDSHKHLTAAAWIDRFRAALAPGPVLDLGCGTGEPMGRQLIEAGREVVGVDGAPAVIEIARRRFPDQRWLVGDMRELNLGARFGGILMWCSFFHLSREAQRAMFPILAGHAAPGAALMFTSGQDDGEAIGEHYGDSLYHASLATAEYEELLAANGFRVLSYVPADPACGGLTIWLAKFKEA